tara:strand:+ start:2084 stop:2425 length:342 start_codon:yes stop_codon:yes gene_type:complete
MNKSAKILNPLIYSVSFQDMTDIWMETMHPEDNVVVVWDAVNHKELLSNAGFRLDEGALYNNKILTIILDDIRDCFFVMDTIATFEDHPYVQIYHGGKLLTDNLENLRHEIPN